MAITRIKNNQITDATIVASAKTVEKTVTAGLLEDNLTYGSNLTVTGNLTVNGSTTTVNSTTVTVDDPMLLLAPDATGSGALDLGFIGERGDDTNIAFVWDESADEFVAAFTSSADSSTTVTITDYADLRVGGLAADDNVTIGGTLGVTGAVTLSDDISAVNITATGTLDVTGLSSLDGGIDVNGGNFTVATDGGIYSADTLDVDGAATLGSTLAVTGATTLTGLLNANGGIAVDTSNFTVDGTTGAVATASTLDVAGAATFDGDVTLGDASGDTITVTGTATFAESADFDGGFTVAGSQTINMGSNAITNVADPSNAQDAATKNYVDTALSAGFTVSDGSNDQTIDISANDTLTFAGTANETTVAVSATDTVTIGLPDDVTIGNDLTVTTDASVGGTLDVTGDTNFNSTTASTTNTTGAVVIDGGLGLAGNLNMGGNLDVDGTLDVTGQTDLGAALNVTGLASLDGGIDMDGVFTVANATGNVSTTGTLNVDGATTMANVTIDAASTIDMGANKVTNVADPTNNQDAATKKYVDDEVSAASALSIAGDTGTDTVTIGTDTFTFSGTANEIETAVTDNEVTIGLPDDVTIGNNLTVTGNLTVSGTTTTVNSTTVTIDDPVYTIGTNTVDDNKDRGTEFKYNDGTAKIGFFGYDDSTGKFTALVNATNTSEVFSGTAAPAEFGALDVTNTNITGTLDVSGLSSLDGGIDVDGAFTVADGSGNVSTTGTLQAAATTITSTLDVTGLSSLDGGIDVDGAFTVADGSGNVDTSGTLTVDGTATFNGSVTLGDANTDSVTINADVSSNVIPGADSTYDLGSNTDRWANIYVDAATITDNVTIGGTLGITGETTLASATVSDLTDNRIVIAGTAGSLEDDANLTFDGTTFEVGTAFDVTAASGNTAIGGTLDVTGVASLDGGIDVDGAFIVSDTSGNISTTGTLDVSGLASLDGGIDVDGAFTVADSTGNTVVGGTLDVTGAVNLNATTGSTSTTTGALIVDGGAGIAENLYVGGNINVAGTFDVTGQTELASLNVEDLTDNRVVIAGADGELEDDANFTFDGTTFVVGSSSSVFGVTVASGNTTIGGTLDVTGNATFNGNVDLQDNDELNIGTGDDFTIVHNGTNTAISNDTGLLTIDGAAGSAIRVNEAGADVDFIVEGDTATSLFKVDAGTDTVVVGGGTASAGATLKVDATDSLLIASGTTAQRPGTGVAGMIRWNSTNTKVEYYDGSEWKNMTADFTVIVADSFNGDGSTVAFTLTNSGTTATTVVSINGVVQVPTTAYAVSGTTLTFTEAPASGDVIDARSLTTTSSVTGIDDGSGSATIDANGDGTIDVLGDMTITGDLVVTGTTTFGNVAVDAIAKGDTSITITDTGTDGNLEFDVDGVTIFDATDDGIIPGANNTFDLGASGTAWANVYATTFTGALTGNVTGDVTGNADTASAWATARTITLGGDLTGNVSIDGSANVTLTATVAANSVALGTDTTGNYVATIAGTANEIEVTGSGSESAAITIGLPDDVTIGNNLTVTGNLTVSGTTTTVNTETINLADNIILINSNEAGTPSQNGGIEIERGTSTNVSLVWDETADKWTVGSGTFVAATFEGALTGNVTGNVTGNADTATTATNVTATANNSTNETTYITFVDGATGAQGIETDTGLTYNPSTGNLTSTLFTGTATSARYADLAEKYAADGDIEPGTVVCFGGDAEVTTCMHDMDRKVAGVVSTDPAYMMNSEAEGVYVALTGRVPCKVVGPVRKGDMMVSAGNGAARAEENPVLGSVIGKALENFDGDEGVIEVVVGRL